MPNKSRTNVVQAGSLHYIGTTFIWLIYTFSPLLKITLGRR